jgi:hypothetical protein
MPCADLVFQLWHPTVSYSVRNSPLSICFESKCVEVNLILETRCNVMMTTLKYTTAFIIQQRIIHPPCHRCPCPDMANTSRNPFSPSSSAPMAKKAGGGRKKAAGVPAAVELPPATAASAGTPKKTRKTTKQKNRNSPEFLDLDSTPFDQRKAPPKSIMPLLVPHTRQNAVRSTTRTALPQPPADVYIPPIDVCDPLACALAPPPASIEAGAYIPPFDGDCNPIDHTLPRKRNTKRSYQTTKRTMDNTKVKRRGMDGMAPPNSTGPIPS